MKLAVGLDVWYTQANVPNDIKVNQTRGLPFGMIINQRYQQSPPNEQYVDLLTTKIDQSTSILPLPQQYSNTSSPKN